MLSQPTGHSYAANQTLNHEMFDKLQMTTFCLSKRYPLFTRSSSFTQILKATLALQKYKMPYTLGLHVKISMIKKYREDLTWHS
jgi:hypothetical protein